MPARRACATVALIRAVALLRRHAGGRLVHEEELRLAGERHGEFEPLHVAIGEFRRRPVGLGQQPDAVQQAFGLRDEAPVGAAEAFRDAAGMDQAGGLDVLAHRHGGEGGGDLERAGHPAGRHAARPQAGHIRAGKPDRAGVGTDLPVQHVEAGALPGAVGADERQHLAGFEREADAPHHLHAAVGFREAGDGEERHEAPPISMAGAGAASVRVRRGMRRRAAKPPRPAGSSSTRPMMTRPSASLE